MASKIRLDELLVQRGLAESRTQAKALILAGRVRTGTTIIDKAGKVYPDDLPLEVESPPRFVSRGGEKLEAALDAYAIHCSGIRILDIGASTGGFTDCLLQRGAASAVCVDVGRAQMHGRLLADPRVTNMEQLNARHLSPHDLPHPDYPLIVIDVSFISLTRILGPAWACLKPGGHLVALVKPQFEAEKNEADRGRGIISDPAIRQRCLDKITAFASSELPGSVLLGTMESPIAGGDGNQEFLAVWQRKG